MCGCRQRIITGVLEMIKDSKSASFAEIELLSNKTYSNVEVEIEGRKKAKQYPVFHKYCPFCGTEI